MTFFAVSHYGGLAQNKHHEFEYFFATTFGRMYGYHLRGIQGGLQKQCEN
jgi:hypothetical protein